MNREKMSVDLGDAGWITLSIEVDVWSISESDAAWVLGLVRTMRELAKLHVPEVAAAPTGQEEE